LLLGAVLGIKAIISEIRKSEARVAEIDKKLNKELNNADQA